MSKEKSLKQLIVEFVTGKDFENSKHAQLEFEKANPASVVSPIYFYRIFSGVGVVINKATKIKNFISAGDFKTCKEAFAAYAVGEQKYTSFNYFIRLFADVQKTKKAVVAPALVVPEIIATPIAKQTVTLAGLTAKEIITLVETHLKEKVTISLKNKQAVIKKAQGMFVTAGFEII